MVHYWSLTSEFSIENLEKFADEVQTVLGDLSNSNFNYKAITTF